MDLSIVPAHWLGINKMSYPEFDRNRILYRSLGERKNKLTLASIEITEEMAMSTKIPNALRDKVEMISDRIISANRIESSIVCAFGAHSIKNGLGRLLGSFLRYGWLSHLATNGAGIIHDWEFAYQGESSEDVRSNIKHGNFGTWQETGMYLNLALIVGAYEGLGYGESIGKLISTNGLDIPSKDYLMHCILNDKELWKRSAASDLLETIEDFGLDTGRLEILHPFAGSSVQSIAYNLGIPFTGHPMFGQDIIYTHKMNKGAAIGRTAERDFLKYVHSISQLEGGVYLSVGSSVMSPMIFEKALSMARNVAEQSRKNISDFLVVVVDIQPESWDWNKGEPPIDNPAYYHRFMKTFSRMGCNVLYICADNRLFFAGLYQALRKMDKVGGNL